MRDRFKIIGNVVPLMGPGFATPTFQRERINGLWVQKISSGEIVSNFLQVEQPVFDHYPLETHIEVSIHDEAVYVFHGIDETYINTKRLLVTQLYYEFENLSDYPYLQRSIGRFLDDKKLLSHANDMIIRKLAHRKLSDTKNYRDAFIHRPFYDEVIQKAVNGSNVILNGRRGMGKSTFLHWLDKEVEAAGFPVLRFDWMTSQLNWRENFLNLNDEGWRRAICDRWGISSQLAGIISGKADDFASFRQIAQYLKVNGKAIIIIVDNIDILTPTNIDWSFLEEILELTRMRLVQFIGALSINRYVRNIESNLIDLEPQGKFAHKFLSSLDHISIHVPDLSAGEINQLLENRLSIMTSTDLDEFDRALAAQRLAGLNFREVLQTVLLLGNKGINSDEKAREIVAQWCEASFSEAQLLDTNLARVLHILKGAKAHQISLVDLKELLALPDTHMQRIFLILLDYGFIKIVKNDIIQFNHRFIRDWWLSQHA